MNTGQFTIASEGGTLWLDNLRVAPVGDKPSGDVPIALLQNVISSTIYGSWEKKVTPSAEGVRITNGSPKGGMILSRPLNLQSLAQYVPVFIVKAETGNKVKVVRALLIDQVGGNSEYNCEVQSAGGFVYIRPPSGVTLSQPQKRSTDQEAVQRNADLSNIKEIQIQGNYSSDEPLSVVIRGLYLQAPGAGTNVPSASPAESATTAAPATPAAPVAVGASVPGHRQDCPEHHGIGPGAAQFHGRSTESAGP